MTHRGPFQPLPLCDSVILWSRWECRHLVLHATLSSRRVRATQGCSEAAAGPGCCTLVIRTVVAVLRQSRSLGTCILGRIYRAPYFCWSPFTSKQTSGLGFYSLTGCLQVLCWRQKTASHNFMWFSQTILTGSFLLQTGSDFFRLLGVLRKNKGHNLTLKAPSIK